VAARFDALRDDEIAACLHGKQRLFTRANRPGGEGATSMDVRNQLRVRVRVRVKAKQLRRGSHRSTRALEDAIRVCLADHNANPKPFVWVKPADDIIDSIARFALRTSGTGH
jgi:hypothetical protein